MWTMNTVDGRGWPQIDATARHLKDGRWHLNIGLNGDAVTPEAALEQVIADAGLMLHATLAADDTYHKLAEELKALENSRKAPAATLANAAKVLTDVATRRADPALLQSDRLTEVLAALDQQEQLAQAHQRQGQSILAGIDAKLTQARQALETRRKAIAQLVLEKIGKDIPTERQLVTDAFLKAAAQTLTLLASVEAAAQALGTAGLLQRLLDANQVGQAQPEAA